MEFEIDGFRHDAGKVSEICEAVTGRFVAASAGGGTIRLHDDGLTKEEADAIRKALEEAAKEEPVDPRQKRRDTLLAAVRGATTVAQLREAVAAVVEAMR
jgi:hypothetical protein